MLKQIKIIDECDTLGQKFEDEAFIHEALVAVYKDLLLFYFVVVHVLTKKSVVLAWITEQFKERIPPVVQDFLKHAAQLYQHIENARIRQLLGSNMVEQLEKFHLQLAKKTANDTCTWATDSPIFRTWHEATGAGPLAIYGEMGCGKTITMAFLMDHVTQLNNEQIPSSIICYHYCRDDETGKSLYVYSNFLQQLMQKKNRLKVEFNTWFEKHQSESSYSPCHDSKLLGDVFFS